jgi:LPS sulfotransferase NodH
MHGLSRRRASPKNRRRRDRPSERKSYAVCTTARSGSNLLCSYLEQTGILGRPMEFLNPDVIQNGAIGDAFGKDPFISVTEYIDWLYDNMSTDNQVFGIKILYEDFVAYRGFPRFQKLLDESVLFYLSRNSKMRQAVSYYVAQNTGQWMADDPARTSADDLPYDYAAIDNNMEMLSHQHIEWQVFLSSIDRPVTMIEYEQVVRSPIDVIGRMGRTLGIDFGGVTLVENFHAQRGAANDRLLARYKEDLREFYYEATAEAPYEGLLLKP